MDTILKKRQINEVRWIRIIGILIVIFLLMSFASSATLSQDVPPGFFGYRFFRVSGVSMEPTIANGSILIVKQTAPEMIQKKRCNHLFML